MLDAQSLQFKPRILLASFMYLVLAWHYRVFTLKHIQEEIGSSSRFLLEGRNNKYFHLLEGNEFNSFFGAFVRFTFGFNLVDLLPAIQFASSFFVLQFQDHVPQQISKKLGDHAFENYEEFLSFQTHNEFNLQCVTARWKRFQ
jgi:hypothetical protein